ISGHKKECYRIKVFRQLFTDEATAIREAIVGLLSTYYDIIYIDVKDVLAADLTGINEIIHSHYTLKNVSKQLVLHYRMNSEIERWVKTTGLDKFVTTAIVPFTI
ncbi:MAG: hypothetical protein H7068_12695, partial [Pedobacter sp.]|nr:hypothetical protein [Chitinophagaceae bacterium]